MKWLVLVLALVVVQEGPREGPWAHKDKHRCWRNDDGFQMNGLTFHTCTCKMRCDEHGNRMEDYSCQTACNAKEQCLCHTDETCEPMR